MSTHHWDEDGVCMDCGADGAEAQHLGYKLPPCERAGRVIEVLNLDGSVDPSLVGVVPCDEGCACSACDIDREYAVSVDDDGIAIYGEMTAGDITLEFQRRDARIAELEAEKAKLFAELIEANRWARIFRTQRDEARKALGAASPTDRKAALAAAKAEAMRTGKSVRV